MRTISPASLTMTIASGVDSSSSRKGRILLCTASYACHVMGHTLLLSIGCHLVSADCLGRGGDIAYIRSAHEAPAVGEISVHRGISVPKRISRTTQLSRRIVTVKVTLSR